MSEQRTFPTRDTMTILKSRPSVKNLLTAQLRQVANCHQVVSSTHGHVQASWLPHHWCYAWALPYELALFTCCRALWRIRSCLWTIVERSDTAAAACWSTPWRAEPWWLLTVRTIRGTSLRWLVRNTRMGRHPSGGISRGSGVVQWPSGGTCIFLTCETSQ